MYDQRTLHKEDTTQGGHHVSDKESLGRQTFRRDSGRFLQRLIGLCGIASRVKVGAGVGALSTSELPNRVELGAAERLCPT